MSLDLYFSHLQSVVNTAVGREGIALGIETFCRRILDGPVAFPPEFWELSPGVCRHDVGTRGYSGGNEAVAKALGGGEQGQKAARDRREAIRGRRTEGNRARGVAG